MMSLTTGYFRRIVLLGIPISLTFVVEMVMSIIDSIFAGYINYTTLAALALAHTAYVLGLLLLVAVEVAASIMAGQSMGANNEAQMRRRLCRGNWVAVILGIILALVYLQLEPIFLALGQPPEVALLAQRYLNFVAFTFPIVAVILMIRAYLALIDQPWRGVAPTILAMFLNALLNYLLAYGNWGFPALGIVGIGLATLLVNVFLLLVMIRVIGRDTASWFFAIRGVGVWRRAGMLSLFSALLPIACSLMVEEAFFAGSAILAGRLGDAELAGHYILLQTTGFSYMFNSGIGVAVVILVGKAVGAKQFTEIVPILRAGWMISFLFTVPLLLMLWVFDEGWIGLFVDRQDPANAATIGFVYSARYWCMCLLIIDAFWLIGIEGLRGMLDNRFAALGAVFCYLLIALPLAYYASSNWQNGFVWIWQAMIIGASLLTVLALMRLTYHHRNGYKRLRS